MKKYFAPLGIFVGGNIMLLVVFLFFPALGQAETDLASNTSAITPVFWGWSWLMTVGVIRLAVFLMFEGVILWATGKAFLAQKNKEG